MEKRDDSRSSIVVQAARHSEELKSRRYRPKTVEFYDRVLRDLAAHIGTADVRAITSKDLERYRDALLDRGFTPSSVNTYFQSIRSFFRYLEAQQIIFESPAEKLAPLKKPAVLQPVPTEEEMRILLSRPDTATPTGIRNRALLETLYSTGLRRQEILGLTITSLNLEEGRARVMGKGQRERVVPLGRDAVEWLGKYLAEVRPAWAGEQSGDALWLNSFSGRPLEYEAFNQILLKYVKGPGITTEIGMHSIRRACASHMLAHGASPVAIQALLGHAALKHLSQYLKVTIPELKRAHAESRVGK